MKLKNTISYKPSFQHLVSDFNVKLSTFNPIEKAISIQDYFGPKKGTKVALRLLYESGIIETADDFQGLYVFLHNKVPLYIGISQKVANRIQQHIKGHTHFQATFAFRIALDNYQVEHGVVYDGQRAAFDFKKYVPPVQAFLTQQQVAVLPIDNPTELYLFEVYCAMQLGTPYNEFKTH
ncbi:MAG: hypothetical protein R2828_07610 [Saprospiraceae bacterium]